MSRQPGVPLHRVCATSGPAVAVELQTVRSACSLASVVIAMSGGGENPGPGSRRRSGRADAPLERHSETVAAFVAPRTGAP